MEHDYYKVISTKKILERMEVTDLKELKKLMKGDARDKFEFEEDHEGADHETDNDNNMYNYKDK